jgi:hypothetical protein
VLDVCDDGDERSAVVQGISGWGWSSDPKRFRPLQSDREKAIEEMARIFYSNGHEINDESFGALYDAGFKNLRRVK